MGGIGGGFSIVVRDIVRFRGIRSDVDGGGENGVGEGGGESPIG